MKAIEEFKFKICEIKDVEFYKEIQLMDLRDKYNEKNGCSEIIKELALVKVECNRNAIVTFNEKDNEIKIIALNKDIAEDTIVKLTFLDENKDLYEKIVNIKYNTDKIKNKESINITDLITRTETEFFQNITIPEKIGMFESRCTIVNTTLIFDEKVCQNIQWELDNSPNKILGTSINHSYNLIQIYGGANYYLDANKVLNNVVEIKVRIDDNNEIVLKSKDNNLNVEEALLIKFFQPIINTNLKK